MRATSRNREEHRILKALRREAAVALATLFVFALWLSVAPRHADALAFIGTTAPVRPFGGLNAQYVETELECELGDGGVDITFQIQDPSNLQPAQTIHNVCSDVLNPFAASFMGFTKRSGRLITSKVFPVRDLESLRNLNVTRPLPPYLDGADVPTGRRLLEVLVTLGDGSWSEIPDSEYVTAMCINALAHGQNPAIYQLCDPGPSPYVYQQLNDSMNQEVTSLQSFQSSYSSVNETETTLQQDLQTTNQNIANAENTTSVRLSLFARQINNTYEKYVAMTNALTTSLNAEKTAVAAVSNSTTNGVIALGLLVNSTATNSMIRRFQMTQFFSSFANTFNGFMGVVIEDFKRDVGISRLQQKTVNALSTQLSRFLRGDDMKQYQNAQIQQAFTRFLGQTNQYGDTLYPFTLNYGTAPVTDVSTLGPLFNHITHVDLVNRKISYFAGTPYGVATRQRYQCRVDFGVRSASSQPVPQDMLDAIGPKGCDMTWTGPASTWCDCGGTIEETRCVLQNSGGIVTAQALSAWRNATTLVDTTTGCLAAGVPFSQGAGGLDGTSFTTLVELASIYVTMAQRDEYTPYPYTAMESLIRHEGSPAIPTSDAMRNATNFMLLALPPNTTFSQNLVFYNLQEWAASYAFLYNRLDSYRRLLDGDLPNGMQQESILYQRLPDGQLLTRGTRFSIWMASQANLVVSKLAPNDPVASVQYTINGVPGVVTPALSDINDPYRSRITSQKFMVWSPSDPSTVYDMAQTEISLSKVPGLREYKTTLIINTDPTRLARDAWEADNGGFFKDRTAVNMAALYAAPVDTAIGSPTYQQCTAPSRVGYGPVCAIRDQYTFSAFGTFTTPGTFGSIVYTSRSATYRYSLVLLFGPVSFETDGGCPDIGSTLVDSDGGLVIPLTNGSPGGSGTLTFRVQQFGACASGSYVDVDVARGSTVSYRTSPCATAPPLTPDYLQFSYVFGNTTVVCSTRRELAPIGTNGANPNGADIAPLANYTYQMSGFYVDSVASSLLEIETDSHNLTASILSLQLQSRQAFPFRIANVTFVGYNATYAALAALQYEAQNDSQAIAAIVTNLTDVAYPYDAEIARLRLRSQAAAQAQNDSITALVSSYARVKLDLAAYANAVSVLNKTDAQVIADTDQLGASLDKALAGATTLDTHQKSPDGYGESGNVWHEMASGAIAMGVIATEGVTTVVDAADSVAKDPLAWILNFLKSFLGMFGVIILILLLLALAWFLGPPLVRALLKCCREASKTPPPRTVNHPTITAMSLRILGV